MSPEELNPHLAIAALALANASYNEDWIHDALKALGFTFRESAQYSFCPTCSVHRVAFALGAQRILVDNENWDLIVVTLRGTVDWTVEWLSNVAQVLQLSDAFELASREVMHSLFRFLAQFRHRNGGQGERTVFLVTGHSRGAAVANWVGARLGEFDWTDDASIYVYAFATPGIAKESRACPFIINILNRNDYMVRLMLHDQRFGQTIFFNPKRVPGFAYWFTRKTKGLTYNSFRKGHAHEEPAFMAFLWALAQEKTSFANELA